MEPNSIRQSVKSWVQTNGFLVARVKLVYVLSVFVGLASLPLWLIWLHVDSEKYHLGVYEFAFSKANRDYLINIESFDPDKQEIVGTAESRVHRSCSEMMSEINNPTCVVTPLRVRDQGTDLKIYGIHPDSANVMEWFDMRLLIADGKPLDWNDSSPTKFTLTAIGDPAKYPFDHYLVIGNLEQLAAYIPKNGTPARIDLAGAVHEIDFHVPGYVPSLVDEKRLSNWVYDNPEKASWNEKLGSPSQYWKDHVFYFEIKRPFLFRTIAFVVAIVALFSVIVVALRSKIEELFKALGASFVSLWALRSILASSSPKVPTALDYGVIFLFGVQLSIVAYRVLAPRENSAQEPVDDA